VIAIIHEIVSPSWIGGLSNAAQAAFWFLVLLGGIVIYLVLYRILNLMRQRDTLEGRFTESEKSVSQAYQRLETIFHINQIFIDASDENEVVAPVLKIMVDLVGATGASFVPLDHHGQPKSVLRHGDLPAGVVEDWLEYLASPGVRSSCETCNSIDSPSGTSDCPLLLGPFSEMEGLVCLPLRRGEREFGVMTLFFPEGSKLEERTHVYMRALVDTTSLGLDSVHLRRRELAALRQMQSLRQKTDLRTLLEALLENVYHSLDADFAEMVVPQHGAMQARIEAAQGEIPDQERLFIDGVIIGVMASAEPVLLGDVTGNPDSPPGIRSLMASPLVSSEDKVVGAILVGSNKVRGFNQRQLALLLTVAGQVALVVQNENLMAELEYTTMIQERTRLAREIHDGLAQTIGFLKLQVAQMQNISAAKDYDRLNQSISVVYQTLSEAYLDARQAIDGLRISTGGGSLADWVNQSSSEFQEISELKVHVQLNDQATLPPEFHAQLIRILQEALSNIRKHAQASQVWIRSEELEGDLIFEVRDDGVGFSPQDISSPSQHGLRGMRERSDLLGADFQVVSRPNEGTSIRLRLPLKDIGETIP